MAARTPRELMSFNKGGVLHVPLLVIEIEDKYILAVHQGSLSEFDMLVKYRQKIGKKWSNLRTPKHIHWAVDILIKLNESRRKTQAFLNEFIQIWNTTIPVRSAEERTLFLNRETLLERGDEMTARYEILNTKGEYSVKFLTLLAVLLMVQEKTNRADAYMFGGVLEALKKGQDIFSIVSSATYSGRK
jgi:hypothetical protein